MQLQQQQQSSIALGDASRLAKVPIFPTEFAASVCVVDGACILTVNLVGRCDGESNIRQPCMETVAAATE